MKKFSLSMMAFFVVFVANAQFSKGQQLFGPTLSFGVTTAKQENGPSAGSNTSKQNNSGFSPGISLITMKSDKKGVGFSINYNHSTIKVTGTSGANITDNTSTTNGFNAAYFQRKFIDLKKGFYFFYDIGLVGEYNKEKVNNKQGTAFTTGDNETVGGYVYVNPGFVYRVNPKLLLEANLNRLASLGYSSSKGDFKDNNGNYSTKRSSFNGSTVLGTNQLLNNINFSIKWVL
jgi:hypothetical protein